MSSPTSPKDALTLVIAAPTTWTITRIPGHHRQAFAPLDALDELGLGADGSGVDDPEAFGGHAPLPDDLGVAPVWSWTAVVDDGRLAFETFDGATHRLDGDDARVLATLPAEPTLVADVVRACTVADAGRRLARLLELDLVRMAEVEAPHPGDDIGQTDAADPIEPVEPASTDPEPATATQAATALGRTRRRWLRRRRPVPVATEPEPLPDAPPPAVTDDRIPVHAVWHRDVGPPLSLGMLTASARVHEDLNDAFAIHRPEEAATVLADLAARPGPAVLLCSNYVWSIDDNLAAAREAVELNPSTIVVHGGPSTPRYEADAAGFLALHGASAHILCHGEGEQQVVELLRALRTAPALDAALLREIPGLTFVDPDTGEIVRTADPERIADLEALPSPYLTGEFDHIDPAAWPYSLSIETNRGCPYGCTFCDWGSATLSRIRKFPLDRVAAEVAWAAKQGIVSITIADANFGIMSRDVETTTLIADVHRTYGAPSWVSFTPAKNTTKHLTKVMDILREAGIVPTMSISLQTIDEGILEALNRSNISTEHFLRLAAALRLRGHPLQSDLLLGVPEQTYETFRADLQFNFDHEILVRTWPVQLLPNAPMNDPEYRERYQIQADEHGVVLTTASFDEDDRARMYRLRRAHTSFEVFGLLRHVLRWAQWDHGIEATRVMDHLLHLADTDPLRFPRTTWLLTYFDIHTISPAGWAAFYQEVREVLVDDLGLPDDSALDTVLRLNRFLMPTLGREFPATIDLPHDYLAYYRSAVTSLFDTGLAGQPERPLRSYGPERLTILGDPLDLCSQGPRLSGDSRDEVVQGDFYMASTTVFELHSPLTRMLPHIARTLGADEVERIIDETIGGELPERNPFGDASDETEDEGDDRSVSVTLRARS